MKLYHRPPSGYSHRARLLLSLLGAPHQLVEVDPKAGARKTPAFRALNLLGQAPVLDDGGVVAASNAILVYLAKTFDRTDWLPASPAAA